ncbi:26743_t:CDS:2, partial [Racocetra persica]
GVIANRIMESSTIHTAPNTSEESLKIAGSASSLFHDSIQSPFDSLFSPANDSNPTADLNITESHLTTQTNETESSYFDNSKANEPETATTQVLTDYSGNTTV